MDGAVYGEVAGEVEAGRVQGEAVAGIEGSRGADQGDGAGCGGGIHGQGVGLAVVGDACSVAKQQAGLVGGAAGR
ncbi:hypothetical protein P910_003442, partial [Xylella fastidiosa Mul-MD]